MEKVNNLRLGPPDQSHYQKLHSWFSNAKEIRNWGGPDLEWPIQFRSLMEQMDLDKWLSRVLVSDRGMVGFGQYCLRFARCHLGRLIISPEFRGQGLAKQLIHLLIVEGHHKLDVQESSLWVMNHNTDAIRAYLKTGFQKVRPPDASIPGALFMVRKEPLPLS